MATKGDTTKEKSIFQTSSKSLVWIPGEGRDESPIDLTWICIIDVLPFSLMIGNFLIIPHGSNYPIRTHPIYCFSDSAFQPSCTVQEIDAQDCVCSVKHYDLNGFPPTPRGVPLGVLSVSVDLNGMVSLECAHYGNSRKKASVTQTGGYMSLREQEIQSTYSRLQKEFPNISFADVEHKLLNTPLRTWPKEIRRIVILYCIFCEG
jgi:molecular chaperone DnaK (HSP70)